MPANRNERFWVKDNNAKSKPPTLTLDGRQLPAGDRCEIERSPSGKARVLFVDPSGTKADFEIQCGVATNKILEVTCVPGSRRLRLHRLSEPVVFSADHSPHANKGRHHSVRKRKHGEIIHLRRGKLRLVIKRSQD
jgi:hypothetical protein